MATLLFFTTSRKSSNINTQSCEYPIYLEFYKSEPIYIERLPFKINYEVDSIEVDVEILTCFGDGIIKLNHKNRLLSHVILRSDQQLDSIIISSPYEDPFSEIQYSSDTVLVYKPDIYFPYNSFERRLLLSGD